MTYFWTNRRKVETRISGSPSENPREEEHAVRHIGSDRIGEGLHVCHRQEDHDRGPAWEVRVFETLKFVFFSSKNNCNFLKHYTNFDFNIFLKLILFFQIPNPPHSGDRGYWRGDCAGSGLDSQVRIQGAHHHDADRVRGHQEVEGGPIPGNAFLRGFTQFYRNLFLFV